MNQQQFERHVRTTLRLYIAAARERAELVDALEGSVLWLRLLKSVEGVCAECGTVTECFDEENNDWICDFCLLKISEGQERDHYLDDPRHGQAAEINGKGWLPV